MKFILVIFNIVTLVHNFFMHYNMLTEAKELHIWLSIFKSEQNGKKTLNFM